MGKRVTVDICLRVTLVQDTADPFTLPLLAEIRVQGLGQ